MLQPWYLSIHLHGSEPWLAWPLLKISYWGWGPPNSDFVPRHTTSRGPGSGKGCPQIHTSQFRVIPLCQETGRSKRGLVDMARDPLEVVL